MWFFISLHSAHWMFICTFILLNGRKKQLENVWKHAFSVFVCVFTVYTNAPTHAQFKGSPEHGNKESNFEKSTKARIIILIVTWKDLRWMTFNKIFEITFALFPRVYCMFGYYMHVFVSFVLRIKRVFVLPFRFFPRFQPEHVHC